jgi:hypothetical protein
MKIWKLLAAIPPLLACSLSAARAQPAAILTDRDDTRVTFGRDGMLTSFVCKGSTLICGNAFSACTSDGQLSTKPAPLDQNPFYINAQLQVVTLSPTGTEDGAPVFDVSTLPKGTSVFIVINNPPTGTPAVGVHSFWEYKVGTGHICVRRKLYNTSANSIKIKFTKEGFHPCEPGSFEANLGQASYTLDTDTLFAQMFLTLPGGITGPTHRYAGSTSDSAWATELSTCGLSDGFTTDPAEGDRWLELALDFRPGGSILAPVSQLGYERYVAACLDIQCEEKTPPPPGGSNCQCDDQYPCPFSPSYWKANPTAWPVNTFALGNESYTKTELLALLNSTATDDASISLAQQLIAAKLNVANGSNPSPVAKTIALADALLGDFDGKLPYSVSPSSDTGETMAGLTATLEAYNLENLTPGCKVADQ